MGILEIIVIALLSFGFVYIIYRIYSPKKKKKEKKEKKEKEKAPEKDKSIKGEVKKDDNNIFGKAVKERKIEPVVKKGETITLPPEEEEKELVLQKEPPKQPEPFRVIRKQSSLKISKKALKSGSRNPSVTKVFDNGKRIDIDENSTGGLEEDAREVVSQVTEEINKEKDGVMTDITSEKIGHYGIREHNFDALVEGGEFRMQKPKGSPNRAPIIGDRTNFASHLRVTDDNNLSGVMGTGVAKIIAETEEQSNQIQQNADNMIRDVKKDLFGDMPRFGGLFGGSDFDMQSENKNDASKKLQGLDAETIMIAQAVAKRKGKIDK